MSMKLKTYGLVAQQHLTRTGGARLNRAPFHHFRAAGPVYLNCIWHRAILPFQAFPKVFRNGRPHDIAQHGQRVLQIELRVFLVGLGGGSQFGNRQTPFLR